MKAHARISILCFLLMGCTGGHITSPIEYVLPDGYRGEFEIVESKDGDPLPIENGAEVCHIPASGTLHIDTLESFRNYHRESARYVSGFALPIRMTDEAERAPNEVCVYTLSSSATLTQMRAWLLISGLVLCGCNSSQRQTMPAAGAAETLSILDEAVANYSNALVQAQQELPSDKWEERRPFRVNVSRDGRVMAVAKPMFDEMTTRLKQMSVTNLVGSFKLIPYPYGALTNDFGEAAEYVYAVGNQLIKNEIKARPPEQLRGLCSLGSDKFMLVEGPQGFGLPLTYELEEILDDLGLTNGWSR